MTWFSTVYGTAVVGVVLLVLSFFLFRFNRWVSYKLEAEDYKFLRFWWHVARISVAVGGLTCIIGGILMISPALGVLWDFLITAVYL